MAGGWPVADPRVRAARPTLTRAGRTLKILAGMLLGFALYMQFGSGLHHYRAQQIAYAELRGQLAKATAPVGPYDVEGHRVAMGAPVAVLDVPTLGIHEVVLEGTNGTVLQGGPGHRRDTVLPGQAGTSVLYGRKDAYGGPFRRLGKARLGDVLTVTTGQGKNVFKVVDRRRAGEVGPSRTSTTAGHLMLATADGSAFLPDGVFTVEADLVSTLQPTPERGAMVLSSAEGAMAWDRVALVSVLIGSQLLLVLALAVTWCGVRWGRLQTWVIAVPALLAAGIAFADQVGRLLPNMM
jgi:LPXTG-site transpeptidase (sortase) family protein